MMYVCCMNSLGLHDVAVVVAVPSEGPVVVVKDRPGHNEAELVWKEIPQHKRRGFITNYTIFYSSGSDLHSMYPKHTHIHTGSPVCLIVCVFFCVLLLRRHHRSS